MAGRWEILAGELRVQFQLRRTVKANPKAGGFAPEWSETSTGHTDSTSHIPAAFTVCMNN